MKKSLISILLMLPLWIFAQSGDYVYSTITYAPDTFAGTMVVFPSFFTSNTIPLPFDFCFYGRNYNDIKVSRDGFLTFDLNIQLYPAISVAATIPSPTVPKLSVLGVWQNLYYNGTSTNVYYQTLGTAPFRRFIISYNGVFFASGSGRYFGQIKLFETTNKIEVHITDKPYNISNNTSKAILGINLNEYYADAVPSRIPPTNWTTANESWQFSPVSQPCANPVPGGIIGGKVYYDQNGNCMVDPQDYFIENIPINFSQFNSITWTGFGGNYAEELYPGPTNVMASPNPKWSVICPYTNSYSAFATPAASSLNNYFVLSGPPIADLWTDLSAKQLTPCSIDTFYLAYGNNGVIPVDSASITIELKDSLSIISAGAAYNVLPSGKLEFNLSTVRPGQRELVSILVQSGCAPLNSHHCFTAKIQAPNFNDSDSLNNQTIECLEMGPALVGNFIQVLDSTPTHHFWDTLSIIDSTQSCVFKLHYSFQDTNSLSNCRIILPISEHLDTNTITLLSSSVPCKKVFKNGKLELFSRSSFQNLQPLPGNGFIKIRINQKPGNQFCTHIIAQPTIIFNKHEIHKPQIGQYILPVKPSFNFLDTVCSHTKVQLYGGSPQGGTYSGWGVSLSPPVFHSPSVGLGLHPLVYTYDDGLGCKGTANDTILVLESPSVYMPPIPVTLCHDDPPFALTIGTPVGGNYYGSGVYNNTFIPDSAGAGTNQVYYSLTLPSGCSDTAAKNYIVKPFVPTPAIFFIPPSSAALVSSQDSIQWFRNGYLIYKSTQIIQLTLPGIYTAKLYAYNCESKVSNPIYWGITGQNTPQIPAEIQISPNPANQALQIKTSENAQHTWQFINMQGQIILDGTFMGNLAEILVSHIPAGIYEIRIMSENALHTQKLSIQH